MRVGPLNLPEDNLLRTLEPHKNEPTFRVREFIGRISVALANILSDSIRPIRVCSGVSDFYLQRDMGNFEPEKTWIGFEYPLTVADIAENRGPYTNSDAMLALTLRDEDESLTLIHPHSSDLSVTCHSPIGGAAVGDEVRIFMGLFAGEGVLRVPKGRAYLVRNDAQYERVRNKTA